MHKKLYYILLLPLFFVACEEIYHPSLETVSGQLVVDAKITNDPARSVVHLSKTRHFYSDQPVYEVSGASVSLVEVGGNKIKGMEATPGYYKFSSLPVSGKQYYLQIIIENKTYESKAVTMPPTPRLSNFYVTHIETPMVFRDGEGTYGYYLRKAGEMDVDIPINDSLPYYRLDIRSLVEWTFDATPSKPGLFPTAYGWFSYQNKQYFHLIGPKDQNQPGRVVKHPLLSISYDSLRNLYKDSLRIKGWILFVEQYGTSKDSYEFHQQLNDQFAASGRLFDPIQSQVYGNILCKSNPSEKVYGYFDLNSYKQSRYFVFLNNPPGISTWRQLFKYPEVPDHGMVWGLEGDPPLKPDWWEE